MAEWREHDSEFERLLVTETVVTRHTEILEEATVSYVRADGNLEQTGEDRRSREDEIVVTLEEVNTAIAQNAPRTVLTPEQKETIKRLTESILKRNAREQGVLPTALQREITLAHVVTNFNKTRLQQENVSAFPGLSTSPQVLTTVTANSRPQTVVTTPPQSSATEGHRNMHVIAAVTWKSCYTQSAVSGLYVYGYQLPYAVACCLSRTYRKSVPVINKTKALS